MVVGVLPASFRHPFPENARQPDVLVPFRIDRRENLRSGHYLQAIARLSPGATIADARSDLQGIAADLERQYPDSNTGRGVAVQPLLESMIADTRPALAVLLGAVALVLIIACANLANLFLARSTARVKEIALRQALGASRWQVVRPIVAEGGLVAATGAVSGLVLASWIVRAFAALGADRIPRGDTVAVDARVALFAFALAAVAALVFSAAPAIHAVRTDGQSALKETGRGVGTAIHRRAHRALVASEMALALMLLVSAGLLLESFWKLQHVDPGFRAASVLTFRTSLPLARYPEGDEIPFYQQLETRLTRVPGVERVGAVHILPLSADYSCDAFEIAGRDPFPPGAGPCAEHRSATPGYFDAMGIVLLRGRAFDARDVEGRSGVAIVSEAMARRFWPGGDAIGARIVYQKAPRTIVGIVADVKHFGLDRDAPFELYTPHAQQPSYHSMIVAVRTMLDAESVMPSIRRELSALDRDVPISDIRTMTQMVALSTTEPRFRTTLVGAFAALAVVLAVVGVAGVIAYAVGRRRQEIGVRVALGATAARITGMMLAEGLQPTVIGVAAGSAGALALMRVLSGLLFEVRALDPVVFLASAATLVAAAALATYIPARRAATIDPAIALRAE
jgi:putative ABC transport system permease protein